TSITLRRHCWGTSPPLMVPRALQVAAPILLETNSTDPSARAALTPPAWRLRAAICLPVEARVQGIVGSGGGGLMQVLMSLTELFGVLMVMNPGPAWSSLVISPRLSHKSVLVGSLNRTGSSLAIRISDMSRVFDVPSKMSPIRVLRGLAESS